MKKTTNIVIANTPFVLEEDAFRTLEAYLTQINEHLSADPDKAEIVKDIETRIAELFLAKDHGVITAADVDTAIATVGVAEDFLGDSLEGSTPPSRVAKKLYRDPDDVIIAGVASGIAAYSGLDTTLVRILFILSLFVSGLGVLLYIILWLIVPEATTASQKLAMRGEPVTLNSVKKVIQDRLDETKERGTIAKLIRFPFLVIERIFRFLNRRVFPLITPIVGVILAFIASVAFIGITTLFITAVANYDTAYVDFPLARATSFTLLSTEAIALYLTAAIPALGALFLGAHLIRRRAVIPTSLTVTLLGVWAITLITSIVGGTRIAGDFHQYTITSPEYATVEEVRSLEEFNELEVVGLHNVTVTQGETFEVMVTGKSMDVKRFSAEVSDNTLTLSSTPLEKICIFCVYEPITIELTVPDLDSIAVTRNGRVTLTNLTQESLTLEADRGVIEGEVTLGTLIAQGEYRGRFFLEGEVGEATITLSRYSSFTAPQLLIENTSVTLIDRSEAILNVSGEVEETVDGTSTLLLQPGEMFMTTEQ